MHQYTLYYLLAINAVTFLLYGITVIIILQVALVDYLHTIL